MNTFLVVIATVITAALAQPPAAQVDTAQMAPVPSMQAPSIQQPPAIQWPQPLSPIGTDTNAVKITQGPVVEHVTDTTAEIAWSTNVNSGTSLHYGIDPTHLDDTAGMPWGGLTHRVTLKDLKPNTTYYFKAESGQGQGTGTRAEAEPASFQTKAAGQQQESRR